MRTATVGALEDLGYEPIAARAGPKRLPCSTAWNRSGHSDVIMPEMRAEMVRELSRAGTTRVLFVTGMSARAKAMIWWV